VNNYLFVELGLSH